MQNKTKQSAAVAGVVATATLGVLAFGSGAATAATVTGTDIKFPGPSNATIEKVDGVVVVEETFGNFGNIEKQLDVTNDGRTGNQIFSVTATNNTNKAWSSFVFNLVGGDGLPSFDTSFLTSSNVFSRFAITDTNSKLKFFGGSTVGIGDEVSFSFAVNIPDLSGKKPGFGIQEKPSSGNVEEIPTPALLPGLIGMGVAAFRKRNGEAEGVAEA